MRQRKNQNTWIDFPFRWTFSTTTSGNHAVPVGDGLVKVFIPPLTMKFLPITKMTLVKSYA